MNLLTIFLRRSKRLFCIATFAGVLSGLSTTALIVILNHMIGPGVQRTPLIIDAFSALCIVRLCSGFLSHALLVRLSQNALHDLRLELCRRIMNAPLRQLEQIGPSPLINAFTDDMQLLAMAVINLPYVFVNAIILAGCFIYLGWLSWQMLLGMAVCFGVGAGSYLWMTRNATKLLQAGRREQEQLVDHFAKLVAGAKELKLHARRRSEFVANLLEASADGVRRQNTAGITIYSAASNWGRLLFFVYVGLLLLWSPNLRSAAEVAASVIVILYMMAPLEAILNALPVMAQASVALEKIQSMEMSFQPDSIARIGSVVDESPKRWRELALVDVEYSYQARVSESAFTLGPVNLVLRPGEVTLLVGGNGSGKTTLGKLIVGLYRPDAGEVRLDGEALTNLGHQETRSMFSAVFNDFCLFDELLGIDPSRVQFAKRYLRSLQLDHKVLMRGSRFSTTELSQGQRKRLALLVALLEDRPGCRPGPGIQGSLLSPDRAGTEPSREGGVGDHPR
jgi:putative ATP-binding cassette transporter